PHPPIESKSCTGSGRLAGSNRVPPTSAMGRYRRYPTTPDTHRPPTNLQMVSVRVQRPRQSPQARLDYQHQAAFHSAPLPTDYLRQETAPNQLDHSDDR